MPRFAANLSMMFTEVPFIERFAAAAEAGFQAVEFLFPYDFAASEIKAQLSRHDLTLALMAHVIAPRLSIICVMPPTGLPPTINVF